jgi:hypothetical protein
MHDKITVPVSDSWIMNRLNPVEIWSITKGGIYRNPDWSRKEVSTENNHDNGNDDVNPNNNNNDDNNGPPGPGGGGGGGCFIISSGQ